MLKIVVHERKMDILCKLYILLKWYANMLFGT